jgi:hypothetical protein
LYLVKVRVRVRVLTRVGVRVTVTVTVRVRIRVRVEGRAGLRVRWPHQYGKMVGRGDGGRREVGLQHTEWGGLQPGRRNGLQHMGLHGHGAAAPGG